jgi:hypothetical protein
MTDSTNNIHVGIENRYDSIDEFLDELEKLCETIDELKIISKNLQPICSKIFTNNIDDNKCEYINIDNITFEKSKNRREFVEKKIQDLESQKNKITHRMKDIIETKVNEKFLEPIINPSIKKLLE